MATVNNICGYMNCELSANHSVADMLFVQHAEPIHKSLDGEVYFCDVHITEMYQLYRTHKLDGHNNLYNMERVFRMNVSRYDPDIDVIAEFRMMYNRYKLDTMGESPEYILDQMKRARIEIVNRRAFQQRLKVSGARHEHYIEVCADRLDYFTRSFQRYCDVYELHMGDQFQLVESDKEKKHHKKMIKQFDRQISKVSNRNKKQKIKKDKERYEQDCIRRRNDLMVKLGGNPEKYYL